MISLKEYIIENVNDIFEDKSSDKKLPSSRQIKNIYIDLFGNEYYNKCGNKSLKGDKKHVHELFRGFIGNTEDDAINNANKFLQKCGLSDSEYNLEYNLKDDEASGQYPSIKVTFNNKIKTDILSCDKDYYLFIVNTVGKVKRKELTPSALGVADHKFCSSGELKNIIKTTTSKNQYNAILVNLFDILTVKDEAKKESLDEILNEDIKFENINIGEIDKQTLMTILVDFGEILGGAYLLNTLKGDHTLMFPGKSNFKNVDYFIDYNEVKTETDDDINKSTISISAKAGTGADPSCVSMAQTILSQLKTNIISKNNLDNVDSDFLEYIIPALGTLDKGFNNSSIITCQNKLFNFLSDKDVKYNNIMKLLSDNQLYSRKKEAFNFNRLKNMFHNEKEKIYEIIKTLYDKNHLDYKPSDKFNITDGINCELFNNIDKYRDLYYGCIAYPLRASIVKYLNDNYHESISTCCKLGLGYYQIYVKYSSFKEQSSGNTCTLVFTLKKLDHEDNWKLEPSGSVNNPKLKAIACKPVK